jgi:DNA-binding GntR family transcriptional regulator
MSTLSQQAYEFIQQRIVSGELAAGDVISEHSVAREIGISRTPVREAIQQLESEGLVEQVARYGTIVRRPERRDVVELYELREALECFAVRRAAEVIDAAAVAMLQKLCGEMAEVIERFAQTADGAGGGPLPGALKRRFLAADMAFHMVIIRATGNRRIMKSVGESRVLARIFATPRQQHDLPQLRSTQAYHESILAAVQQRQGDAAERTMRDHIRASMSEALAHFDRDAADRAAAEAADLPLPADLAREFNAMQRKRRGSTTEAQRAPRRSSQKARP